MNNPTNPNKITSIIMIALGFALIFIVGNSIQSYFLAQSADRNIQLNVKGNVLTRQLIEYLKDIESNQTKQIIDTNTILSSFVSSIHDQQETTKIMQYNNQTFIKILSVLEQINNNKTK